MGSKGTEDPRKKVNCCIQKMKISQKFNSPASLLKKNKGKRAWSKKLRDTGKFPIFIPTNQITKVATLLKNKIYSVITMLGKPSLTGTTAIISKKLFPINKNFKTMAFQMVIDY